MDLDSLPESVQDYIRRISGSGLAKRIILFGSRARGDFRSNSDFDIVVEWFDPKSKEVLLLLSELQEASITLYKIDLLNYNDATESYLAAIRKEGKVLWEKKG